MSDNKYDIREFNEWLKEQPSDGISWSINSSINNGKIQKYFFKNTSDVHQCQPNLTWSNDCLSVIKKWMEIKDNQEILKKEMEIKIKEKLEFEKTESFSKQSFENKEKKQLEEIYNILFPNQTYSFDKLKEKLEKLRIHDLSLEIKKEKNNYENLINSLKEELDDKFSKILNLFLVNEYIFENNLDISLNQFLIGKRDAYRIVLEIGNVNEEKIKEILNVGKNLNLLEKEFSKLQVNEDLIINENSSEDNYYLVEGI